jgi:hypothetical protein
LIAVKNPRRCWMWREIPNAHSVHLRTWVFGQFTKHSRWSASPAERPRTFQRQPANRPRSANSSILVAKLLAGATTRSSTGSSGRVFSKLTCGDGSGASCPDNGPAKEKHYEPNQSKNDSLDHHLIPFVLSLTFMLVDITFAV